MARESKLKLATNTTNKVTLADLQGNFIPAWETLMASPLSMKASIKLLSIGEEVQKHQKHFEEVRVALIRKYGKKNEEGGIVLNDDKTAFVMEDPVTFDKEYRELCDVEVEIPTISATLLETTGPNLSPKALAPLLRTVINADL